MLSGWRSPKPEKMKKNKGGRSPATFSTIGRDFRCLVVFIECKVMNAITKLGQQGSR